MPGRTYAAEFSIALSHLRARQEEGFVSVVTVLSVTGVVVGVAVLNMVLSVMTGFEIDLRDKILGANAHIVVLRYGGNMDDYEELDALVEAVPGVAACAPFVYGEMMIRSPWSSGGVILKGIDPVQTGDVTSLREDLRWGIDGELTTPAQRAAVFELMATDIPPPADEEDGAPLPGIIIGKELMEQLQAHPGDTVQIINPLGGGAGPMGMPVPQVRPLRIAAVFDSGMYEYDTKWTYISNDTAQKFLKLGDTVTGLEVKVSRINNVERISADIDEALKYPHYTRHWKNLNQALFQALKLEKLVMALILTMIVVVAALLIITTLTMLVITKSREIAIMKAMGASSRSILRIFMMEGALIGLVGTVLGTIMGLIGCWGLSKYDYQLETDVYYLDTLPVVVQPEVVLTIGVGAFCMCFLATIYPAMKASGVDPVVGLRYE